MNESVKRMSVSLIKGKVQMQRALCPGSPYQSKSATAAPREPVTAGASRKAFTQGLRTGTFRTVSRCTPILSRGLFAARALGRTLSARYSEVPNFRALPSSRFIISPGTVDHAYSLASHCLFSKATLSPLFLPARFSRRLRSLRRTIRRTSPARGLAGWSLAKPAGEVPFI